MDLKEYRSRAFRATFITWPLLTNVYVFSAVLLLLFLKEYAFWLLPLGFLPLLGLAFHIYRFEKNATLPDTFLSRYEPFLAPILFALLAGLFFTNEAHFSSGNIGLLIFLPFVVPLLVFTMDGRAWIIPIIAIASYLFFMVCFAVATWRSGRFRTTKNYRAIPLLAIVLILAFHATIQGYGYYQSVLHPDWKHPALRELQSDPWQLRRELNPNNDLFQSEIRLVSPGIPPSLRIDRDYPKLDGATALVPVYAAAAKALYRESRSRSRSRNDRGGESLREKAVGFSTTPAAYQALLDGKADMIFVLAPSEVQQNAAAVRGITYTLTPIAREAFVFLVNEQNPITGLSVEQIRDIYSGKINDWREVGGTPGNIMAFQRNEGSGSQTAMLRNVMRETPMRKPLEEERHGSMGGLLRGVADYRNFGNAIGYTFRYYATVMNSIPEIRLMAVDGVAPTVENIQNGSYPFIDDIYIVTARPLSENAQKLRDWFLSDEGQQFIAKVGYVPLKRDAR